MTPIVSIIILTKDEEENLPFALESLQGLDADVFVVDSGSADRTVEIAQEFGATVVEHPWDNYARQLNWAIDNLPFNSPWLMRLDADERLMPELVQELRSVLPAVSEDVAAFLIKRRVYFWKHWIRHGGYYPTWLLRVWRHGKGRCEDLWMDEHMVVSGGKTQKLKGDIIDENHKGLTFWVAKHNAYSDREVKDILTEYKKVSPDEVGAQAARRRFLKRQIYGRCPRFLRAFLYWAFRYFVQLGFLDGRPGFVCHFLQGFWYRLIVDAKLDEAENERRRKPQRPIPTT
jgi:glycosyltransferase involved in cell wall biosynthesis